MAKLPKIDGKDVERDQAANDCNKTIGEGEVKIAFFRDGTAVEEVGDADRIRNDSYAKREDKDGDKAFIAELEHVGQRSFKKAGDIRKHI